MEGRQSTSDGTPMTAQAASRIQSADARNSGSRTTTSGFAARAQSAAARTSKT
ncbi:hypothetical protein OG216_47635 (plasmid) [Streptomycetaceae bacterium NBC_01309]